MTTGKPTAKQILNRLDPDVYRWFGRIAAMVILLLSISFIGKLGLRYHDLFVVLTAVTLGFPAFATGWSVVRLFSKIRFSRNHPLYNVYLVTRAVLSMFITAYVYLIIATIAYDNHLSKFYGIPINPYGILPFSGIAFFSGVGCRIMIGILSFGGYSRDDDEVSFRKLPVGAMFSFNGYRNADTMYKVSPTEFTSTIYADLGPTRIDNTYSMVYPRASQLANSPAVDD